MQKTPISKLELSLDSDMSEESEVLSLEESDSADDELEYQPIVHHVMGEFRRAKTKRETDEIRWLESWRNYRGVYGPEVQFTSTEKSKAFIKITKTKVLAAYAQVLDILFSTAKFPIAVEPTPVVENVLETVHFDPEEPGQGEESPSPAPVRSNTISRQDILELVGPLKDTLEKVPENIDLKEGQGKTPTSYTFEPAKEAARNMEKKIQDQLEESGASKHLRATLFEMAQFGTGVFKGPFAKSKEYPRWTEEGQYKPVIKVVADTAHVSIWDSYPDPDGKISEEFEFFIERHRMTKTKLRQLKKRPYFRASAIDRAVEAGYNYKPEHWEMALQDSQTHHDVRRFEVIEYWGILDKELAEKTGLEIPEEYEERDQVQVNIWVCNNQVLRLVLNPFTPTHIPYYVIPYEINPYSVFGVGVAENMTDTQLVMNGFMRLAVDNAVLSSNVVFEVNDTNLVPGQNMDIYPGKVFKTQGQLGQSIHAINIPNVTQQCIMMFDKARQLADEATGMPSYSHGISGVMGVGRTASGMSMLMGAAKENIKSVIRNIDDYLLMPLGKALFAFNMQFDFDPKCVGDLEIVSKGTESLMRNEVRSQKLLQFYQITQNPQDAPFTKRDYLLREIAASLDLDPDKSVNDPREAGIQAAILAEINKTMGVQPQQQQGQTPPAGLGDPTGSGGNMSPGMAPEPGADGFTGGGGGMNSPAPAPQGAPM